MNLYLEAVPSGVLPMPEVVVELPSPFCNSAVSGGGFLESQLLGPDPFSLARARRASRRRVSINPGSLHFFCKNRSTEGPVWVKKRLGPKSDRAQPSPTFRAPRAAASPEPIFQWPMCMSSGLRRSGGPEMTIAGAVGGGGCGALLGRNASRRRVRRFSRFRRAAGSS